MQTFVTVGVQLHVFFSSELYKNEWSASWPDYFPTNERSKSRTDRSLSRFVFQNNNKIAYPFWEMRYDSSVVQHAG
jgi:hypothetical protein